MKKTINGKMYDTATAKSCGKWDNGRGSADFDYVTETLYLKKTGEYFLQGVGGPLTQYAEHLGDGGRSYGERLIPMSEPAAREWAEQHLDGDEYERIFGELVEDDSTVIISVRIAQSQRDKLLAAKETTGKSVSALIADFADTL